MSVGLFRITTVDVQSLSSAGTLSSCRVIWTSMKGRSKIHFILYLYIYIIYYLNRSNYEMHIILYIHICILTYTLKCYNVHCISLYMYIVRALYVWHRTNIMYRLHKMCMPLYNYAYREHTYIKIHNIICKHWYSYILTCDRLYKRAG